MAVNHLYAGVYEHLLAVPVCKVSTMTTCEGSAYTKQEISVQTVICHASYILWVFCLCQLGIFHANHHFSCRLYLPMQTMHSHAKSAFACKLGILTQTLIPTQTVMLTYTIILAPVVILLQTVIFMQTKAYNVGPPLASLCRIAQCTHFLLLSFETFNILSNQQWYQLLWTSKPSSVWGTKVTVTGLLRSHTLKDCMPTPKALYTP